MRWKDIEKQQPRLADVGRRSAERPSRAWDRRSRSSTCSVDASFAVLSTAGGLSTASKNCQHSLLFIHIYEDARSRFPIGTRRKASRSRTGTTVCPSVSRRFLACPPVLNRRARRVLSSPPVSSWFRNCVTQL